MVSQMWQTESVEFNHSCVFRTSSLPVKLIHTVMMTSSKEILHFFRITFPFVFGIFFVWFFTHIHIFLGISSTG